MGGLCRSYSATAAEVLGVRRWPLVGLGGPCSEEGLRQWFPRCACRNRNDMAPGG
jgi:hypothetical protein